MSRPLVANPKRSTEAYEFHRAVFTAHGNKCAFESDACELEVSPRSELIRDNLIDAGRFIGRALDAATNYSEVFKNQHG